MYAAPARSQKALKTLKRCVHLCRTTKGKNAGKNYMDDATTALLSLTSLSICTSSCLTLTVSASFSHLADRNVQASLVGIGLAPILLLTGDLGHFNRTASLGQSNVSPAGLSEKEVQSPGRTEMSESQPALSAGSVEFAQLRLWQIAMQKCSSATSASTIPTRPRAENC